MNSRPLTRLATAASAALLVMLAGCVVAPLGSPYYGDEVMEGPPAPRYEVVGVAPFPSAIWISGYWGWSGHHHDWVPGRWAAPRPGYRWVPHDWQRQGRGWRESPGYWQRGGGGGEGGGGGGGRWR